MATWAPARAGAAAAPAIRRQDRMRAGRALLDPADVQGGRGELDLVPAQVHQFGSAQAVPVGHQDHGGVAVAPAVSLGGLHQPLDLGLGQVFAGAQLGVGGASGELFDLRWLA